MTAKYNPQESLTMDQMKFWLTSQEPRAVNWRQDPANKPAVSQMITEFASRPGGISASMMQTRLKEEKTKIKNRAKGAADRAKKAADLEAAAKAEFLEAGGTESEFEADWPKLRREILASGRGAELVEKQTKIRRSKATRTF